MVSKKLNEIFKGGSFLAVVGGFSFSLFSNLQLDNDDYQENCRIPTAGTTKKIFKMVHIDHLSFYLFN